MILAIAAAKNYEIAQFDVKTAYLNGDLDVPIFMKQPVGFSDNSGRVCKLRKSLYGLKQAARCWNKKFVQTLLKLGLKQCVSDPCLFVGGTDDKTIIGIYVDDGMIIAPSVAEINAIMNELKREFEMSECKFGLFLGMEIEKNADGISIGQRCYAERVLEKYRMESSHPVSTPCNYLPNYVLPLKEKFPYREAVGSLMYLAVMTRPDISYAVGVASRDLEEPTSEIVLWVKRILRYLRGTTGMKLQFASNSTKLYLNGYCDADYAGCTETRRSTSGYVFQLGAVSISWRSERQRIVATSTTEAEFIAAAEAVKELIWLRRLLREVLGSSINATLHIDNQGAMKLIENPVHHKRTKHIDVRYFFIREKFHKGLFILKGVRTNEQAADIFTKGLGKELHLKNMKMLSFV